MSYEWIHGFSQCWPPGSRCEVWWDAWAVVAALVGLWIGLMSMWVTALSALAVFWLGKQANALANGQHVVATQERHREARFLLAYLYSEVLDAKSTSGAWLATHGKVFVDWFETLDKKSRRNVVGEIVSLDLPLARSKFDRLHIIDGEVGMSLANALSTMDILRLAGDSLVGLDHHPDNRLRLETTVGHVQSIYSDLVVVLEAARIARVAA